MRACRAVLVVVIAAGVLLGALSASSCGGGGDPDAEQLKDLRVEARDTWNDGELIRIIDAALAIAARSGDKPLGQEAFAFAEDLLVGHSWAAYYAEDFFVTAVPAPEGLEDPDQFLNARRLIGFVEATPAGYKPEQALATLHQAFLSRLDWYFNRLDHALEARRVWASDLKGGGTTSHQFTTEVSGAWEEYGKELAYLRTLAVRVDEVAEFLIGCDLIARAIAIADYEPPAASREYKDNTFIANYTLEAVEAGAGNAEALDAAIFAAREQFSRSD